jgi:hypothetical protein
MYAFVQHFDSWAEFKCFNCQEKFANVEEYKTNYCPSCGHKLDKFFNKVNPRWGGKLPKWRYNYPLLEIWVNGKEINKPYNTNFRAPGPVELFTRCNEAYSSCGRIGHWQSFAEALKHLIGNRKPDKIVINRWDGTKKEVIFNG